MALYRKYRPASFAEVIGQEHVTAPLSTALDAGRINHAYLFSGPRGCGKTSSARILARSLNCVQGPTSRPCGVCDSCVGLGPGGAGTFDVVELDAASHGGVEDTRDLRDRAAFAPAESRYRIFIIDEAHMVSTAGFNALLKVVEEPPEHVVFIFATTEPEKVLPTIRSRTHHYPFRLLAPATMRGLLERVCQQESVSVEAAVFPLVIRAGGGSPRDSLSVLDQLLAGAEDGITYTRALSLLGVTDVALIDDAVDALAADDGAALYGTVHRLVDAGHDPRRFSVDLLERLRDLILLQAVPDAGERGLVDAPGDVLERMGEEARRIGPATLARYAEIVHTGLGEMRGATAPRLLLEVMCARMLLPAASDTSSALLQRLERVERRMTITPPTDEVAPAFQRASQRPAAEPAPSAAPTFAPAAPTAAPVPRGGHDTQGSVGKSEPPRAAEPGPPAAESVPPAPPATPPAPPAGEPPAADVEPPGDPEPASDAEPGRVAAAPGQPDAAAVRTVWSEVRSAVRERSRTTEVMLSSATVRRVEGETLVLSHDSAPLAKRLVEPRNAQVLQEALRDVLGVSWQIECESGAAPPRAAAPSAPAPSAPAPSAPAPAGPDRPAARYTRRGAATEVASDGSPADEHPPPEEPPEPVDEEEMLAEAAEPPAPDAAVDRRDPAEAALELLAAELGARPLDGR